MERSDVSGTCVVAGASGNVGNAVMQRLAQLGCAEIRALTRSSTNPKLATLKGSFDFEMIECDLSDKASLSQVFEGATTAFLSSANFQGQVEAEKNFIDCAVASGVKYLVKLGTVRCYTSLDSNTEYARYHAEIEEHLENTAGDMNWTVLSPNWFMSNHLGDIFGTLPNGIIAYANNPEATARIIDPRDVGDLAAALLLAPDHSKYHGLKLNVSGPEAVSMAQVAALYTEALGRPIQAVQCSVEDWVAGAVASGFPEWLAQAVSNNFDHWDAGHLDFVTSPGALDLAAPQRTMSQWVSEWAPRSPPPPASE